MEEKFPGVWKEGEQLYTENLVPGGTVYDEELVERDGREFRRWDPNRSKLGAAIRKGIPELPLARESCVLYLGAASGTTPSHVSDICRNGMIYCVEYSPKVMRDLLKLPEERKNIAPVLADARKPREYSGIVDTVDVVFQDVAQPDQFDIVVRNTDMFLRKGGSAMVALKARSISSSRPVEAVLDEQKKLFEERYNVLWSSRLEPFEEDHLFLLMTEQ